MKRLLWLFAALVVLQACDFDLSDPKDRIEWRNPSLPPRLDVPPRAPATAHPEIIAAFDRLNEIRLATGLAPVEWDAQWASDGARHANYLVVNHGLPETTGLERHNEYDYLPGYTPEGAAAGVRSNLSATPPRTAVDRFLNTLYHRTPMLRPGLKTVGIGWADDGTVQATVMTFGTNVKSDEFPVAYPPNDATDVPWAFLMAESPYPLPDDAPTSGYPVTLAYGEAIVDVVATLYDGEMREVPVHFSSPEKPAREGYSQGNVVCLFSRAPMKPGERYTVEVSATHPDGERRHWRWSFRTIEPVDVDTNDAQALERAIGKHVRVRSPIAWSRRTGSGQGTYALEFGQPVEPDFHVWIRDHSWRGFEEEGFEWPLPWAAKNATLSGVLGRPLGTYFSIELLHPSFIELSDPSPRVVDASRGEFPTRFNGEVVELRTSVVRTRAPYEPGGTDPESAPEPRERAFLSTTDGTLLTVYARPEAFLGFASERSFPELAGRPLRVRGVVRRESATSWRIDAEHPAQWGIDGEVTEEVNLDEPRAVQATFGRVVRMKATVTAVGENTTGRYVVLGRDRTPSTFAYLLNDVWPSLQAQGALTLDDLKGRLVEVVAAPQLATGDSGSALIYTERPDQIRLLP